MIHEIKIPQSHAGTARSRVNRLLKRLERLKITASVEEVPSVEDTSPGPLDKAGTAMVTFRVRVPDLVTEMGWSLLGYIHHLPDGSANYLTWAGRGTVDDWTRFCGPVCEHCGWTRKRKTTVALRKEADVLDGEGKSRDGGRAIGTVLQVGTTCVADFLGGAADRIAKFVTAWQRFREVSWAEFEPQPEDYLDRTEDVVRGLCDRALSNGWDVTFRMIGNAYTGPADWTLNDADRAGRLGRLLVAEVVANGTTNDRVLAAATFTERRHFRILATALRDAARRINDRRPQPAPVTRNRHLGTVGETIGSVWTTCTRARQVRSRGNLIWVHHFTMDGSRAPVLVYFKRRRLAREGYRVQIRGARIVRHDVYRGTAQTVIGGRIAVSGPDRITDPPVRPAPIVPPSTAVDVAGLIGPAVRNNPDGVVRGSDGRDAPVAEVPLPPMPEPPAPTPLPPKPTSAPVAVTGTATPVPPRPIKRSKRFAKIEIDPAPAPSAEGA